MASGYPCDYDGCGTSAAVLLTDMGQGNTLGACPDHLALMLIPVVAGNLGVEFPGLYAAVEKHVKAEAKKAERELAAARAAEATQAQGDEPAPGDDLTLSAGAAKDASMADIIPDDWSGEAMT